MRKYLLPRDGNFYKANLHSHSTVSDGRLTPSEMKDFYMAEGYSVIAYTDHNKYVTHNELTDDNFLALNGAEIDINDDILPRKFGKTCHFCMIALDDKPFGDLFDDITRVHNGECISKMMQRARDNGFFVTYNHPKWSMENYTDYMNYHGMHAMEIYNHDCIAEGHDEHDSKEYDDMLKGGKRIYCIATDDNHNNPEYPDWFGGFTMIKADNLSYTTITDALLRGDFYASEGPIIHELYIEDKKLYIKCDPAAEICLNTPYRIAASVKAYRYPVCEAVIKLRGDEGYFRLTVIDKNGKKAYTNAYFTDEIFGEVTK